MGGGSAMLTKNGAWPTVCQMMQVRKDEVGVKALVEVRPFLPSLLVWSVCGVCEGTDG
ncbi:hypothetical protein BT69DRAFT_1279971 [Atractiella rhizophila]|nr:hypothetical protein BT69DRAFT_1279971 [Atractiella rhizophila]